MKSQGAEYWSRDKSRIETGDENNRAAFISAEALRHLAAHTKKPLTRARKKKRQGAGAAAAGELKPASSMAKVKAGWLLPPAEAAEAGLARHTQKYWRGALRGLG